MRALYENLMNSLLATLIDAFLTKVRESEDIMKVHFNVDEPRFFRQNDIPRSGQFGTFKYSFHGIGCRFSYKKRTVDYDYGDGGRIDGFDLWRLSQYGKQFKEFSEFINSGEINREFEQCVVNGNFVRSGGEYDNLYYLSNGI